MTAVEVILSRLEKVCGKHPQWMARCPAHADNSPSLSIKELEDGRVLVHCFAGCGASDILAAIGLTLKDLYPDGPVGEMGSKPFRSPENRLYKTGYAYLRREIDRLRARTK